MSVFLTWSIQEVVSSNPFNCNNFLSLISTNSPKSLRESLMYAGSEAVSRCCTRGKSEESITCSQQTTQVKGPPGFKMKGGCHQKYKTGVSVASKTTYVLQKLLVSHIPS